MIARDMQGAIHSVLCTLQRLSILSKPLGVAIGINFACSQRQRFQRGIGLTCRKQVAIDRQKRRSRQERRPLVSIQKWMVARYTKGIFSGEIVNITIAIMMPVLRPL